MKLKRIMAMVLCFAMVLSTMSFTVFAEDAIIVDSTDAFQAALDAATDGTTIQLQADVAYGTVFIRPVEENENTKTGTNYHSTHRDEYVREVKNLTIIGAEGATVDGIQFVTGTQQNSIWYYADINNLVIDSVTFTENTPDSVHSYNSPILISLESARVDGLTVQNCVMDGKDGGQNFVYIYGSQASGSEFETYSKNVTITNNTVANVARLCELRETKNLTISGNTISNTAQHAILLANSGNGNYSGEITIDSNTADNIADRFVRMAGVDEDATVTISENEITNYTGSESDFIKVSDCASEKAVTIADNTLEGEATTFEYADGIYQAVVDSAPAVNTVATVNGVGYTDIQEAIKAAAPDGTVEILSDVTVDKWIMFAESLSIGNGNLITLNINGLIINGNDHTLTIKSIESAGNGNRLFYDAQNLNIKDLTIKYIDDAENQGGIGLQSGTIENVNFVGGGYGILPGKGNITIDECDFATNSTAIYYEAERDNLIVNGCEFTQPDDVNVILLRGNTTFTNNIVNSGRTVNVVSGSPVVTGNDFGEVRFKVYNVATATIEDNEINVLEFNDESTVNSTFGENTLSDDAQVVLDAADFGAALVPTYAGYGTIKKYYEEGAGAANGTYVHLNIDTAYAENSLVLELYAGDTLLSTTRLDDSQYLKWNGRLTANIEISREADAWETEWVGSNPNAFIVPTAIKVYADGNFAFETTVNVTPEEWAATEGVKNYVAKVGEDKYFETLAEAITSAQPTDTITLLNDAKLDTTITINKSITLDGNGHKITTIEGFTGNKVALFELTSGAEVKFENTTFDGIKNVAVMRSVYADVIMNNCVIQNCTHTQVQGLLRLLGNATITNSKFLNNDCTMVITFCYDDTKYTEKLTIDNCEFKDNSCKGAAVIYFANGDSAKITGTSFIDNEVTSTSNVATIYIGGAGNNYEVSGCTFKDNDVSTSTSWVTKIASAIYCNGGTVNNNVFDSNTAKRVGTAISNVVYVTTSAWNKDGTTDLGENYWGGKAPVPGVDYTGDSANNHPVTVANYYASYDAENGLKDLTAISYVAKVGNYSYTTLADAIAAAKDGDTITLLADVAIDKTLTINIEGNVTIDGNGHKITNNGATDAAVMLGTAGYTDAAIASHKVTLKNVVFDGWATDHVVRIQGVEAVIDGCTIINSNQTAGLALISTNNADVTVKNCVFEDNTCLSVIDVNSWADESKSAVTVENCKFNNNTCSTIGMIVVITGGEGIEIKNNELTGNTAVANIVYASTDVTISGNYFKDNNLTEGPHNNDSIVVAGPWTEGTFYITITGNAFCDDERAVYVEKFMDLGANSSFNLDGNYWNGGVPNYGSTGDPVVDIEKYYTSYNYENGVLSLENHANAVVAQIGETKYLSLQAAIDAAQAGNMITLLADVTEDVIVSKNLTIDGGNFKYTGKMDLNNVSVTIQNVNFVKGQINKNKNGTSEKVTIKNCTFDGQSLDAYAINLNTTNHIVIEDCTAKDYGYGLLQVPSSNDSVSIKNVTIDGTGYAIKVDYSNGVSLENVTITNSTYGFVNSNYGTKTITVKSCNIKANYPLVIWDRNTTKVNTFKFEGSNDFGSNGFYYQAVTEDEMGYTKYVLTENATLSAIADLDVTTNVDGYFVKYVDGTYKAVKAVAQIGDVKYESLAEAFAVGGDVTLLADVELANTITVNKDATLDLNGKTISGTCNTSSGNLIYVKNGAKLTVKDSSTEQTGKITYAPGTSNVGWIIYNEGNLVLESGTLELTGDWSIGYAVDVRPNAWSTAYTEETSFVMNGGKIVSSDGGVRVTSNSADSYSNIAASFTMNDGEIDAAWDGVFVQQSNATWDVLSVTINGGTIESDLNPVRFYGPAATSYVNGEDCVDIELNGGTLTYTGTDEKTWLVDGILCIGGGVTAYDFLKDSSVTASAAFATTTNVADGYCWAENQDGTYSVTAKRSLNIVAYKANVVADEEVIVSVVINGKNLSNAKWVINYDNTKFALQNGADTGVIEGYNYDPSAIDTVFADGQTIATYTFKAIAQTEATYDDFIISNTYAYTKQESYDSTEIAAENNTSVRVNIDLINYAVVAKLDGSEVTGTSDALPFDGNPHTFVVETVPEAVVTYKVNGETVDAVSVEGVGTYNITYTVTNATGYAPVSGEFTLTINDAEYIVEVNTGLVDGADYVNGKKLVLVHTNTKEVYFKYNNALMIDVSDSEYDYEGTKYTYVYAFVTDAIDGGILDDYKAFVKPVYENDGLYKIAQYTADINDDIYEDIRDITSVYGVSFADDILFSKIKYQKLILKADVNNDKMVEGADIHFVVETIYPTTNAQ